MGGKVDLTAGADDFQRQKSGPFACGACSRSMPKVSFAFGTSPCSLADDRSKPTLRRHPLS